MPLEPRSRSHIETYDDIRELVVIAARTDAAGRRFPLLRVVATQRALSATECEALVWELARLRTILAATAPRGDDGAATATQGAWARTISALDAAARLGAASRRGARFGAESGAIAEPVVAARRQDETR